MTAPTPENQATNQENKPSDKELNFRQLEAKYQRQIEIERQARMEAEKRADEAARKHSDDDDDDDEPYVQKKRLEKKFAQFGEQTQKQTQNEIQRAVQVALTEDRKQNWLKQNSDFYDVLKNADKLAQRDPELAESILEMPEGFERQKLVYKNIKALGLDKPEQKAPSIQEKIDSNRRSPYYQPSGMGTAPYASVSDFSDVGQKQAYEKMQDLKNRLRI